MSMVEATIILMITSTLAAVLAPTIMNYVEDARRAKARADVEIIGTALARMLNDVGELWVLRDGSPAVAGNAPDHSNGNRADLLVSRGGVPTLGLARSSGAPDWNAAADNLAVQTIDNYLVLNAPSNATANAYRDPTQMNAIATFDPDTGAQFNSEFAWRGPYITGPIGPDPWSTRYAVNVEFLAKATGVGVGVSGSVTDVFVLSAGGNLKTETRFDVGDVTPQGDDVIYVVSGGTR